MAGTKPSATPVFGQPVPRGKVETRYHLCGHGLAVVRSGNGYRFKDRRLQQHDAVCPSCDAPLPGATLLTEAELIAAYAPATIPSYSTPLATTTHALYMVAYKTRRVDAYHVCGHKQQIDLAFDTRPQRFVRGWNATDFDPLWLVCPRCHYRIHALDMTPASVIKARWGNDGEPLAKPMKRWQAWRKRGIYERRLKWWERVPGVNYDVQTQRPI